MASEKEKRKVLIAENSDNHRTDKPKHFDGWVQLNITLNKKFMVLVIKKYIFYGLEDFYDCYN